MGWGSVVGALLVLAGGMGMAAVSAAQPAAAPGSIRSGADADVIEGRYIVVYDDPDEGVRAETRDREQRLGFDSTHHYRHAVKGFAARLTPGQLRRLESDPQVDFVSPDRRVRAVASVPLAPGEPTPPTGVRRIVAASTTAARQASGIRVAVIDTGIQLNHSDLNAADGRDCVNPGTPADDGNGHGTHVAGTIAARNNGAGVVGVAPGTLAYAVRVLNNSGSGSWAQVICGIDWVTANRNSLNIRVANMSLGGLGEAVRSCATTTDALHQAICSSTAAGVNYVVAAGNSGWDFDHPTVPDIPAAYPQVLTVTAVSDSDGAPGGSGGSPSCRRSEGDDVRASFSNFAATASGRVHTIAAPGVCIRSTWRNSGYDTISGTSMATPHVAGVVALCINEAGSNGVCANRSHAEVITQLRADAEAYNTAHTSYGFTGDPLHSPTAAFYGFLTVAPGAGAPPSPPPPEGPTPPPPEGPTPPPPDEPREPTEPGIPPPPEEPPPADGGGPGAGPGGPGGPGAGSLTLDLGTKRQRLKGKLTFFATASSATTLVAKAKAIRRTTRKLAANRRVKVKAKLKRKARKRLARKLAKKGRAKTRIRATATDASGATARDTVRVRLKG